MTKYSKLPLAFDLIKNIKESTERYRQLNREIQRVQNTDFPTQAQMCDDLLLGGIVNLLDEILREECGLVEMASYFLYECNPKGNISENGQEWTIETTDDLKDVVEYFSKKI